jgi:nucleotide-binding universal stress UspA family protein
VPSLFKKESQVITHILVPLDGSKLAEGVLPYAKDLGSRLHAKVHFLQVFEGEKFDLREAHSDAVGAIESAAAQTEREEMAAGQYLSQLVSSWRAEGIDAGSTVVEGAPAAKIIETAQSLGVDLITMSTHGRSGLGRLVSGSVADEVVRESGIPVLLVKPTDKSSESIDATASSSAAETGVSSMGS